MFFRCIHAIKTRARHAVSFLAYLLAQRWFAPTVSLIVIGLLFVVHPANAAAGYDDPNGFMNGILAAVSKMLLAIARVFIGLTVFGLKFFIELARYNGYIDAPPVVVGWIMVRDVANMFFVVVLLVIAFGTILGLEQYEWKKTLVRFVLVAVFINFSKLVAQLIIDVAHVFTMTFLNAVSATAGGNLINMFKLQGMMSMLSQDPATAAGTDLRLDLFAGSVLALVFASMAMVTIGAYVVVMALRIVVLWVLMILAPIAYILSVIPNTKSYADEYWSTFTKHVIVAPVMVFFLWLSFATLGNGNIGQVVAPTLDTHQRITDIGGAGAGATNSSVSILEVSTWENMASFIIAIAFMLIGIAAVQKLGVQGGGLAGGAVSFAKNVATIASGYAAGRFLVGGAAKVAGKAGKAAAYYAPLVGGEKWVNRGKIAGAAVTGWYKQKGMEVTKEGDKILGEIKKTTEELHHASPEGQKALETKIKELEEKQTKQKAAVEAESDPTKKTAIEANLAVTAGDIEKAKEDQKKAIAASPEALKTKLSGLEQKLKTQMGGGIVGYFSRSGVELEKQVAKTEKQAETRGSVLRKRVGSESGGKLFGGLIEIGMGTNGLKIAGVRMGGILGDRYAGVDAQDRIEEGWLQGEDARSKAKDADKQSEGKRDVLGAPRLKYDVNKGELMYIFEKGTMMDQVEKHKVNSEIHESEMHHMSTHSREHLMEEAEKQINVINNLEGVKGVKEKMETLNKSIGGVKEAIRALTAIEAAKKELDQFNANEARRRDELNKDPAMAGKNIDEQINKEREKLQTIAADSQTSFDDAKKLYGFAYTGADGDLEKAGKDKVEKETELVQARRAYGEKFTKEIDKLGIKKIPAWELAKNQALQAHHDTFFKGKVEKMKDDAAQRYIWDEHGINAPNNAQLDIIETVTKDLRAMNYESAVAALKGNAEAIKRKKAEAEHHGKKYEVSFEDKAIAVGLMQIIDNGKWTDDAIMPFRSVYGDDTREMSKTFREGKKGGSGGGRGGEARLSSDDIRKTADVFSKMMGGRMRDILKDVKENVAGAMGRLRAELENEVKNADGHDLGQAGFRNDGTPEHAIQDIIAQVERLQRNEQVDDLLNKV